MDFTINKYLKLLNALMKQGFSFYTFSEFLKKHQGRCIILRHDVDKLSVNALAFAKIQYDLGLTGTYYFRIVPASWNEKIIRQIAEMKHEVGYHYEDITLAVEQKKIKVKRQKTQESDLEKQLANYAIQSFKRNLEKFREIVPVETICMHGQPMNQWDNRVLWKYYDYRNFGIKGEPYFDVDFNKVLYLTDTGRCWDGESVNIRDKSINYKDHRKAYLQNFDKNISPPPPLSLSFSFHSTFDIIKSAEEGLLPDKIMITFHPQRWTNHSLPWIKELIWQNTKNIAKYFLIKFRNK